MGSASPKAPEARGSKPPPKPSKPSKRPKPRRAQNLKGGKKSPTGPPAEVPKGPEEPPAGVSKTAASDTLREMATLALLGSEMRGMEREFVAITKRVEEEKQRRGAEDFRQKQLLSEASASAQKAQSQLEALREQLDKETEARAAMEAELADAKDAVKLAGSAAEQVPSLFPFFCALCNTLWQRPWP